MDHIAVAQERIVTEKLRQKLNEVNSVAQSQLAVVQDHVNFTLQKAYFRFYEVAKATDVGGESTGEIAARNVEIDNVTSRIASDTGPSTVAGMKVPGGKR
ncbi:hypothetical protein L1887_25636 [Cichorium endivia]|nr:hypothetical protein L1887_25636 [Cichorium endivia]